MACFYITSAGSGAGKTTVAAALAGYLKGKGRKTGFLRVSSGAEEADGVFMKRVLGLDEEVAVICPVVTGGEAAGTLQAACKRMSAGKDVVIVEGPPEAEFIQALEASVILVEAYAAGAPGKPEEAGGGLLPGLTGVIVNKVPVRKLDEVRAGAAAWFKEAGSVLLGVLPEDRVLLAPSVGELAEWLDGEVLNSPERSGELVENVMVGAMTVDHGPLYYGIKDNKAAVIRAERPDMQLAALDTSLRCLVLCGDTAPTHAVLYEAEKKEVPVIRVRQGVAGTISALEEAMGRSRFGQAGKLSRLADLTGRYFDYDRLAG